MRRCRVPTSKRKPRAPRARCGAGDARACWQRDMTCLQRVSAGRCGHFHGPSAARTAHERALGWDGAEAYLRRQQSVEGYPRTVARWWSRSSPLERGGHVHCRQQSTKRERRTPGPRHGLRSSGMSAYCLCTRLTGAQTVLRLPAHGAKAGRTREVFCPRNVNRAPGTPLGPSQSGAGRGCVHTPTTHSEALPRPKWRSWASA